MSPDSLHLTLRFLGQLEGPVLESLADALSELRQPAFAVALGGASHFGSGRRVRVIHLEVAQGEAGLASLAERIEERCERFGLPREERAFHPHLTLARARDRGGAPMPDSLPVAPSLPEFEVRGFELYRSDLQRAGAVYSVIRAFHTDRP